MKPKVICIEHGMYIYGIPGHPRYGIGENNRIWSFFHHKFIKTPKQLKGIVKCPNPTC